MAHFSRQGSPDDGWDLSGPVAADPSPGEADPNPTGIRPRVLLVEPEQPDQVSFHELLGDSFRVVAECGDPFEALHLARRVKPDLVIVHLRLLGVQGLELVRQLHSECPGSLPVVVAPDRSVTLVRQAMQAGAREFLVEPLRSDDVVASLQHLLRRTCSADSGPLPPLRPPGSGTWCVTSAVGGVGRTTLLLALADGLRELGRRVAVVDLNRMFGDVGFFLDLPAEGVSLADLVRDYPRGSIPPLATLDYGREHRSGLRVFLPSADPAEAQTIQAARLVAAIEAMGEAFDHVLVDFPPGIPEEFLPVLDGARHIFVLGDDRLSAVKNVRAMVNLLVQIGIDPGRLHPVLARLHGGPDAPERYRTQLAGGEASPFRELPHDPIHVEDAVLGGEPITRRSPTSDYSGAVLAVLDDLAGGPRRRKRTPSTTQRLIRRFLPKPTAP